MNTSFGCIAACITLVCWTIGTFSFTKASIMYSPTSINRVRLLYACILLTIITLLIGDLSVFELFNKPMLHHWLWLGISGILGLSIGDYFAFTAFNIMGSSRTSLFNSFAPAAALIGGYVLLGEQINFIGLLGMVVSVSGIMWFVQSNRKQGKVTIEPQNISKGIVYATLGALCQGLGLVFAKKGLVIDTEFGRLMPLHATWIRMFSATIFIYLTGFLKTDVVKEFKAITFNPMLFKVVCIGTIFGPVIGVSMSLYAASIIEVSLAQTIFSLLPIVVMLSAYFLGKEKLEATSFIAAVISLIGVGVLMWQDDLLTLF